MNCQSSLKAKNKKKYHTIEYASTSYFYCSSYLNIQGGRGNNGACLHFKAICQSIHANIHLCLGP